MKKKKKVEDADSCGPKQGLLHPSDGIWKAPHSKGMNVAGYLLINEWTKTWMKEVQTRGNIRICRAFLVVQSVKNLPAMKEMQFPTQGQEDPLEQEMTTHSSILAWKIPWTEEPGRLQSMGSQRVRHDLATKPPHQNVDMYSWLILLYNSN